MCLPVPDLTQLKKLVRCTFFYSAKVINATTFQNENVTSAAPAAAADADNKARAKKGNETNLPTACSTDKAKKVQIINLYISLSDLSVSGWVALGFVAAMALASGVYVLAERIASGLRERRQQRQRWRVAQFNEEVRYDDISPLIHALRVRNIFSF